MKMKKITAALLSVVMLISSFIVLVPSVSAAEASNGNAPFADYESATTAAMEERVYESADEYLAKFMQLRVTNGQYQLYANSFTGEVALKNKLTGQILTTNPYALGEKTGDGVQWWSVDATREKLLSQLIINYKDEFGAKKSMYSFSDAAERGQILVKDIKNGIRVEYIMGRLNTTYLLPMYIMADRFESELLTPFYERLDELLASYGETNMYDPESGLTRQEYYNEIIEKYRSNEYKIFQNAYFAFNKIYESYTEKNPNKGMSNSALEEMQKDFPITAKKDSEGNYNVIWVADVNTDVQKSQLEELIKSYCPQYGYDDLEADHNATMYVAEDKKQPLFRLSLEYVLNEDGMSVRLPASAIRYDESFLTLEDIAINPYFGAGDMQKDGSVFFPDGSGSILNFKDLYNDNKMISDSPSGKVYGEDYAYYTITGQHQESIRMPVYGVVETETTATVTSEYETTRGYLAIITEGDALSQIKAEFGAGEHPFASVYSIVTPRPIDEYELENALSATGSGAEKWTVVSDKKYTGNYKTKIVMLTDSALGDSLIANGKIDSYYGADWIGMAGAYRDYLEENGFINPMTEDDVEEQLPLYIESFGTIETIEKFFSMPITVHVPLTKFSDIQKMYDDLSAEGITNVNFRLVGFANGGMKNLYPAKLKWEKEAGGSSGFKKLLADAKENGYGVYPDFDFLYINETGLFDGISMKEMAVRTVDDRYASKQIYNAVYQDFFTYFNICVASSKLSSYFKKFDSSYKKYNAEGLSLAFFASDLNSNFDEDNPATREDAKKHYMAFLEKAAEKYSILTEGGNIYTTSYVDHMLNMPIESSNYSYASYSVPFIGMVLHGYLNYAGTPFNEAGDVNYNIMRSIENGMSPYYVLSYNSKNTALLKQDEMLSQYYSIRYDIWFGSTDDEGNFESGELLNQYRLLNAAIGDLQTARITDYAHLYYERVRTEEEIRRDELALLENIMQSIISSASKQEAIKKGEYRRDLETYLQIEKLVAKLGTDASLLAKEMAPFLQEIYTIQTLSKAEEIDAALAEFVSAFVAGKDVSEVAVSVAMAEAVANTEALDAAYVAYIQSLPVEDRPTNEEAANNRRLIVEKASAYYEVLASSRVADYQSGALKYEPGKKVCVQVDVESVAADIASILKVEQLTDEQLEAVRAAAQAVADSYVSAEEADETVTVLKVDMAYVSTETESLATDFDSYVKTPYSLNDSRCVMVTYSKGYKTDKQEDVNFILNYNLFDIEIRYTDSESDFTVELFDEEGKKQTISYEKGEVATFTVLSYMFVRIN